MQTEKGTVLKWCPVMTFHTFYLFGKTIWMSHPGRIIIEISFQVELYIKIRQICFVKYTVSVKGENSWKYQFQVILNQMSHIIIQAGPTFNSLCWPPIA